MVSFTDVGVDAGDVDAAGNYQPGDILKQVDVPKEDGGEQHANAAKAEEAAKPKEEISPIEYEFGVRARLYMMRHVTFLTELILFFPFFRDKPVGYLPRARWTAMRRVS